MFTPTFMTSLPMNLFVNNYIYGFRHANIKYVINNLKKKNTVGTIFTD
jgi:hypothetical protein